MRKKQKQINSFIGYVVYVKDNSWFMKNEWIMLKGCISIPVDSQIHLNDCYRSFGTAKASITKITLGRTDCTNCTYEIIPVEFESKDKPVCLITTLKHPLKTF